MSEHLEKAKAALQHAGELEVDLDQEKLPKTYLRLLHIVEVQAALAQAEATERIADAFEKYNKNWQPISTAPQQSPWRGW